MSGVGVSGLIANLPSTITPYPTQNPALELGGYRSVANAAARDAIPASFRDVGMEVTLQDTGATYELFGGIANANWKLQHAPFVGQYFVDPTFTGPQLGSSSNPFTTIAAAFAFAVAQGITNGAIYTRDITENVVFPNAGNWEISAFKDSIGGGAGATITGTVSLATAPTATSRRMLKDLVITGAITGDSTGQNTLVKFYNTAVQNTITLTGTGVARPWALTFFGTSNYALTSAFGGSVTGAINIKGRFYAANYVFTGNITVAVDASIAADLPVIFESCSANSIAISLTNPSAGVLCFIGATDTALDNTTMTWNGAAINFFGCDQTTCASLGQHGATIATTGAAVTFTSIGQSQKNTGLTNNRGATNVTFNHPSPMMIMTACLTLVTPGTLGNAVLNAVYTDSLGVSRTKAVTPALNIAGAAGDEVQGELAFTQNGSAAIQYSVTGITTPGALSYNVNVNVRSAA